MFSEPNYSYFELIYPRHGGMRARRISRLHLIGTHIETQQEPWGLRATKKSEVIYT